MKLEKSECLARFVHYEKKTKSAKGGITSQLLVGVSAVDKPGYFHEIESDYGDFNDTPKKVPSGYRKWPDTKSQQFAKDFYCKSKSKKTTELEGLEHSKWYNQSRKYWLTLGDIKDLKGDDELDILLLHSNALDAPMTYLKSNKSYTPNKFFKSERDKYIHYEDLMGHFEIYEEHDPTPKYLEVEYKKDKWYPLVDGFLPAKNEKGKKLLGKKTHYTELPDETPVGFRGPMILWKDLKKLKKIYFTE